MDVLTRDQRSKNMRNIRGKNTKPEVLLRSALHSCGFRFRLHVSALPGSPDVVLSKYRVAIFMHGCFWHGHSCPRFKTPTTRADFWIKKIKNNQIRDKNSIIDLIALGWRVVIVWECALLGRGRREMDEVVDALRSFFLQTDECFFAIGGAFE